MTLFDPTTFGPGPEAPEPEGGPWTVEVWVPVGAAWLALDQIEQNKKPEWVCEKISDAIDKAWQWVEQGWVLHPQARVTDAAGEVVWRSSSQQPTMEVRAPGYL